MKTALLLALMLGVSSLSANAQDASSLVPGMWIKVEGRKTADGVLVADKIEAAEEGALEIEGIVESIDGSSRIVVSGFEIHLTPKVRIEDAGRRPRRPGDIRVGVRVKVKIDEVNASGIRARLIRLYPSSTDRDLELQAPITGVDSDLSGLSLLSTAVRLTKKTRLSNLQVSFEGPDSPSGRRILRDDDEPELPLRQWAGFFYGGKVGLAHEHRVNFDLTDRTGDRESTLRPQAQVEILKPLSEAAEFYAKFNLNGDTGLNEATTATANLFEVREAYLYLRHFGHHDLALQIGRQRFRDKREWWYDDRLDAVRLHYRKQRFKLELAVAKTLFGGSGSRSDQLYMMVRGDYRLPGRRSVSGYWIKRNDTTARDEDPVWFGVSSRGRVTRKWHYWFEWSRMLGRRGKRKLRGYGLDIGGSYRFSLPWDPTISGGFALGSGDDDLRDGVDGNFRQTRINDNSYRGGGLKRYRYYGVALEPELFNLKISTVDLGLRPSEKWSLNLAYHAYRQVVASRRIGDSELAIRPLGENPALGRELDLIFALRTRNSVDVNFLLGLFDPGAAFLPGSSSSFLFQSEIRYFF